MKLCDDVLNLCTEDANDKAKAELKQAIMKLGVSIKKALKSLSPDDRKKIMALDKALQAIP